MTDNPADWHDAPCRQDGQDPDVWFPKGGGIVESDPARQICAGCPYRDRCLAWALEHREEFGVWGGMSSDQRHAIARGRTTPEREWARYRARVDPPPVQTKYGRRLTSSVRQDETDTARQIIADVADAYDLHPDDLAGFEVLGPVVEARHEAMWRIRRETRLSLSDIGGLFGRDHTTVLYACRKQAAPATARTA